MARLRIKDIAQQAGVSPATVSRYLNNRPGAMTDETRDRIAAVIDRTGYRPSNAARSLRLDRTDTIGVVFADMRNPFSSAMLEELAAQAAERGASLMTAASGNDPAREADAVERLLAAGVDGLIVNTCGGAADALDSAARRVPTALLDRPAALELPLVTSNNPAMMAELVSAMNEAGVTHCLLATECDANSPVRRKRIDSFRAEAARLKMEARVLALDDDPTRASRQVGDFVQNAPHGRPGIIAVNGLVFLRLVEALRLAQLDVPGSVAVATFDEYPWNRVLYGGVTTAVQDTACIAAELLDLVMPANAEKPRSGAPSPSPSATRIEVPGTVVKRASTAHREAMGR